MTTIVRGSVLEQVSVKDFGAVGDGVTDDTAAINAAIDSGKKRILLTGDQYLVSDVINLNIDDQVLEGDSLRGTSIVLGAAAAVIKLSGARSALENLTVDGDYIANVAVEFAADSQSPSLYRCNIQNAEVENVLIDEGCTSWRIIDGTIRNAGNRDATTILTPGATCLHVKSIGEIRGTIIAGATGRGLKLTGNAATEENRVNFIGGRVNFCYGGLIEVDGTSHNKLTTLNLVGTYLENPGIVANSSASNASDIESIYANGDGAVINVYQPLKHLIRNAKYAYFADNNAVISVDHSGAVRAQDLGSTAKSILFGQANGGKINVRSWPRVFGDLVEDDFTDWSSLVDITPAKDISVYSENMKKYLEAINGTSLTGLSSSAVNLSIDKTAGNFLTEGSSIKIVGDGSTTAAASITISVSVPENLVGHYVAFVAPIKFEQVGGSWGGGSGVPRSRIRASSTGVMFPEPSDSQTLELAAPGAGVQTDWYYHCAYAHIEAAGSVSVIVNLDTRSQVRDDIAYLDRVDVFVVDGGLSSADIETTNTGYLEGTGSPSGSVTPDFIGQEYLDTTGNAWYKSYGSTNTDWQAL